MLKSGNREFKFLEISNLSWQLKEKSTVATSRCVCERKIQKQSYCWRYPDTVAAYLVFLIETSCTERKFSLETDSRYGSQEKPFLLSNPKVHYRRCCLWVRWMQSTLWHPFPSTSISICDLRYFDQYTDELRTERLEFNSRHIREIFIFSVASRPILASTYLHIQWPLGALSMWGKRVGRQAHHSVPSSADDKNSVAIPTQSQMPSWRVI
jgi:hypothetical protein